VPEELSHVTHVGTTVEHQGAGRMAEELAAALFRRGRRL